MLEYSVLLLFGTPLDEQWGGIEKKCLELFRGKCVEWFVLKEFLKIIAIHKEIVR